MAECTACSGSNGVNGGAGSSNDSLSAQDIADNLRDASTGPAGLEVDRYAANVDAAMDHAAAGVHTGVSPADIEAAAMSQLNPRQQGQFQQAIDEYRSSAFTSVEQQFSMNAPFDRAFTDPYNAVGVNAQGQAINSCGQVVADLPAQSFWTAGPTAFEQAQAQQKADAMRNLELITSGPFSGLFAAGGVAVGAEQQTIEGLAQVGQIVDGLTSHLGPE